MLVKKDKRLLKQCSTPLVASVLSCGVVLGVPQRVGVAACQAKEVRAGAAENCTKAEAASLAKTTYDRSCAATAPSYKDGKCPFAVEGAPVLYALPQMARG